LPLNEWPEADKHHDLLLIPRAQTRVTEHPRTNEINGHKTLLLEELEVRLELIVDVVCTASDKVQDLS
jgi:hypothetical protein